MLLTLSSRFQSALPRGERLVSVQIVILQLKISIRAPARGATSGTRQYTSRIHGFQSALPRGERHTRIACTRLTLKFQSALPRGERRAAQGSTPAAYMDFNPRSREGSDTVHSLTLTGRLHFNPRSREGSDTSVVDIVIRRSISIRAPARGATLPSLI